MDEREAAWADAMRAERRGDFAAYERLLGEVADWLRGLMRRRLDRLGLAAHEAEDLVQEILIGIHLKRRTWDASRPLLPWLYGIARYKLADAARRLRLEKGRRFEGAGADWFDTLLADEPDPDRTLVDRERSLQDLPLPQRQVVQALAIEGESVSQAAARLHMSDGAVRVLFHRGLSRIATAAGLRATPFKRTRP